MNRYSLHTLLVFAAASVTASAATPLPPWYPGPDTTRQGYIFDVDTLTPTANTLDNAQGQPLTTITLGQFNAGYQQPGLPPAVIDLNGIDNDGAWDIGIAGTILSQITFAPAAPVPGTYYRVDFQVYTVAYGSPYGPLEFDGQGLTAVDSAMSSIPVANDPLFPGGVWNGQTFTGYFDNVTTNTLIFGVKATSNNTANIDTYEVITRYTLVPEPSAAVMLLGSVLLLASRRRRN
jgi:hypothetical protein